VFFILQGTVKIFLARYFPIFPVLKKKVSHCTQAHECRVLFQGAIIYNQANPSSQRQVLRLLLNLALASYRLPKMPQTPTLEGPQAPRHGQGQDNPLRSTGKPSDLVLLLLWGIGQLAKYCRDTHFSINKQKYIRLQRNEGNARRIYFRSNKRPFNPSNDFLEVKSCANFYQKRLAETNSEIKKPGGIMSRLVGGTNMAGIKNGVEGKCDEKVQRLAKARGQETQCLGLFRRREKGNWSRKCSFG
jgi:hypothetical protein